ncbi:hypothetical protein E5475_23470 [Salmonella enterica]|nr:hypothetical protein [Salmonella enterica]EHM1373187.1 winged helix-turn-helix domain-containing protein [Salmonella enterica]
MDSIFGYMLDRNILFELSARKLIQYQIENHKQQFCFKVIALNETQSRLLAFLLENKDVDLIDKDLILKNVWDNFSLSSSNQRLWQTINDLRKMLSFFGLENDFIRNIHGAGYIIDNSKVLALFSR